MKLDIVRGSIIALILTIFSCSTNGQEQPAKQVKVVVEKVYSFDAYEKVFYVNWEIPLDQNEGQCLFNNVTITFGESYLKIESEKFATLTLVRVKEYDAKTPDGPQYMGLNSQTHTPYLFGFWKTEDGGNLIMALPMEDGTDTNIANRAFILSTRNICDNE